MVMGHKHFAAKEDDGEVRVDFDEGDHCTHT